MSCEININYTTDINQLHKMAVVEASYYDGYFKGNAYSGEFNILALGGLFNGTYEVEGKTINVKFFKKPIFIPCKMIEVFLTSYIK